MRVYSVLLCFLISTTAFASSERPVGSASCAELVQLALTNLGFFRGDDDPALAPIRSVALLGETERWYDPQRKFFVSVRWQPTGERPELRFVIPVREEAQGYVMSGPAVGIDDPGAPAFTHLVWKPGPHMGYGMIEYRLSGQKERRHQYLDWGGAGRE